MDSPWILLVMIAIIPVTIGVIFLVIVLFTKRGRVAQTMVEAGNSFELQVAPPNAKEYKLYARYGVEWPYHYGNSGYGLIFDMKVLLDDRVIHEGKIGVGNDTPDGVPRTGDYELLVVTGSKGRTAKKRKATALLLELGPRLANSTILVTGTLTAAPDTTARPTKVYIGK